MSRRYSIEIVNKISELHRVFDLVTKLAKENSLNRECDYNLNLILEEFLLNLIKYGYKKDRKDYIVISIELTETGMTICVEDTSDSFDIRSAADIDPNLKRNERQVGGIGIKLIKAVTKEIDYHVIEGKNLTTFICSKT